MRLLIIFLAVCMCVVPGMAQGSKHRHDEGEYSQGSKATQWMSNYKKKMLQEKPWIAEDDFKYWKFGDPPRWKDDGLCLDLSDLMESDPPGWSRWTEEERLSWEKELDDYREKLRVRTVYCKHLKYTDISEALISLEAAARSGVPIHHAFLCVARSMEKGMNGEEMEMISRAFVSAVGKNLNYSDLITYLSTRLRLGVSGKNVALALYKRIYYLANK